MSADVNVWVCRNCGISVFPKRYACPHCNTSEFRVDRVESAVVEEITRSADGLEIATIRSSKGARLVGRIYGSVTEDSVVPVTSRAGVSGSVYVPSTGRSVAGEAPANPLRGLAPEEWGLPQLLRRQAVCYGEKTLIVIDGVTLSYREAADRASRVAAAFRSRGVGQGDRVATLIGNRIEWLDAFMGCAWLGAVLVPLNTASRGEGLLRTLGDSGARFLLLESDLLSSLAQNALPANLEEVWVVGDFGNDDIPEKVAGKVHTLAVLTQGASQVEPLEAAPGGIVSILYTSGTTGRPKGVKCTYSQLFWFGVSVSEALTIEPSDVLYTCLPLYHSNAMAAFFQALTTGSTIYVGRRFSASQFWRDVSDCKATVTYLLGTMVAILCARDPSEYIPDHRVCRALAPGTAADLDAEFLRRFDVTLIDSYGSTETNAIINSRFDHKKPGYMGIATSDFETRVVDQAGIDVAPGSVGELVCRSNRPHAFSAGYFGDPEATAHAWRDLWFHTSDFVVKDADGWIRFVDRGSDRIRRRGENISSFDVESALTAHPGVEGAAVFGVPSKLGEDDVMAVVVVKDACVSPGELAHWCEARIPGFAVPRYFRFVARLPITETGKINKGGLRSNGVTSGTWDRDGT